MYREKRVPRKACIEKDLNKACREGHTCTEEDLHGGGSEYRRTCREEDLCRGVPVQRRTCIEKDLYGEGPV